MIKLSKEISNTVKYKISEIELSEEIPVDEEEEFYEWLEGQYIDGFGRRSEYYYLEDSDKYIEVKFNVILE